MHRSMRRVIAYLETVSPAAGEHARRRYSCFDRTSENDGQAYGFATAFGAGESCRTDVVRRLVDLQRSAAEHIDLLDGEAHFDTLCNAWTVRTAEACCGRRRGTPKNLRADARR
ncbi:erythromycin esterase family protein [Nocardia gipuzkoensis]|uniref:erythromycin esterase family protein n=1 Tax=Nocardia gipuzkoensis TaxID=2749991 RepID=UPI00237E2FC1|nr:erythromycin esterase family protein [Nocardia gipuzkoensis]MDE1673922.1 erythromycin esterase family protein [Nocardia gipuzkoensis]